MTFRLVIVESPAKGRTLNRYLGDGYVVRASMGHIRDLPSSAREIPDKIKRQKPWARLGVDVQNGFTPLYLVPDDKKKHVRALKQDLKNADELLLATDEDREGESISWHLVEELKPKVPVRRMVFHEITRDAVLKALDQTREIDQNLVQAQEARRIVDRLFGYEVSPVLWKKVRPRLSAGRVQSAAIRMLVDRERQRMAFRAASYWDLEARFAVAAGAFDAALQQVDGRRVATGRDFDPATGALKNDGVLRLDEAAAGRLVQGLRDASFSVASLTKKPFKQRPAPPFTTSTLQQEGGRKLGWTARRTMRTAQSLYENGYITYMRTDSTTLSEQALTGARRAVGQIYGPSFVPEKPRRYRTNVKNAQEAHEAIRPAGDRVRSPEELRKELDADARKLYSLIWQRTLASQMPDARLIRVQAIVEGHATTGERVTFQASGKIIEFAGYLRAYVRGTDNPEAERGDKERLLPSMAAGEAARAESLAASDHQTKPPPRLTEAALVKELEANGIGRPSTYASIIDTIERRDYTTAKGRTLVPTWTAFAVVKLLEEHFPDLVDPAYTARMENDLDAISRGEGDAATYLQRFYYGPAAPAAEPTSVGLHPLLQEKLDSIDARQVCTIPIGETPEGETIAVRIGRYGPYLEAGDQRASMPDGLHPDELTLSRAMELLQEPVGPRVIGEDPATSEPIYVKVGRFGPYVQRGDAAAGKKPKCSSLLRGMTPETVSLETALQLLSLPRVVGQDEDGVEILASTGRFGPYIKRGQDTRSLAPEDDLLTLTRERALTLLKQEKRGRGARKPVEPLRVFENVEGLGGATVRLMPGRFGPYVTDGETNASIAKGRDPQTLTAEEATDLILARRARAPARKPKRRKTAKKATRKRKASKKAGRKTATKKKATRKAPAKKKAAKRKPAKKAAAGKAKPAAATKSPVPAADL